MNTPNSKKFNSLFRFIVLNKLILVASQIHAAPLDLITIRQSSGMYPNIMLTIDDSDSMTTDELRTSIREWRESYYFKEGTFTSALPFDWRHYGQFYNTMYYDTNKTYQPWYNRGNAPVAETFKAMNAYYQSVIGHNFTYSFWNDTANYGVYEVDYTTYYNYKSGPNNQLDYWDDHATLTAKDDGTFTLEKFVYTGVPSGGERFTVTVTQPAFSSYFSRTSAQEAQNIANWFAYHRTREHKLKLASGELFRKFPNFYYGVYFLNNVNNFTPIRPTTDTNPSAYNNAILEKIYANTTKGNTPMIGSIKRIGTYFKDGYDFGGTFFATPLVNACQANINFIITDGSYTDMYPIHGYGDVDGDGDNHSIADVARYYYINDLAPSLPDIVPSYTGACATDVPAVSHQSLSFYFLTLGITNYLTPDANNCWPAGSYGISSNWGSRAEDQTWHAAYNSRGLYKSTMDPSALYDQMEGMFNDLQKEIVFNSTASTNSNLVSEGNSVYYSKANLTNNIGYLVAQNKTADLTYKQAWEAGDLLKANSNRKIFSYNSSNKKGVALTSADTGQSLAPEQRTRLGSVAATLGSSLYTHNLAAILNSDINYVGQNLYMDSSDLLKSTNQPGRDSYAAYHAARKTAQPVIYIGSFDNMLHAFNATTGQELFAYVPSELLKETMFSQDIKNEGVGVDGHQYVTDVYSANDGWRTLLIGGLRRGGQGYYALDITNPQSFSASNVLWELTDAQTPEIGLTFARPAVGTFENGKTYAVLANGYNNTDATSSYDRQQSTTGRPSLFIVDVFSGSIVKTFYGRKGSSEDPSGLGHGNGFAEPALVDSDNDGLVDTIYVGDWFGEFYSFKVEDSQPNGWTSYGGSTSGIASPILAGTAVDSFPITTRPVITQTQIKINNAIKTTNLVIFGTGQNFTKDAPIHPEYIVGLVHDRDGSGGLVQKSQLVQSSISISGDTISSTGLSTLENPMGWYIKLDSGLAQYGVMRDLKIVSGELEVILDPKPNLTANTCNASDNGLYNLVLNPRTGGPTLKSVFLNKDGTRKKVGDNMVVGQKINSSEASLQVVLGTDGKTYNLTVEDGAVKLEQRGALNAGDGRQSWRRLY